MGKIDKTSFDRGMEEASFRDLKRIVECALIIEKDLYSEKSTIDSLFNLRKSLEGIWGHDLPNEEEKEE